jgi:hypothetical protein
MTYESIRDSIRRPFEYLGLLASKQDEPNNLGIGAAYTVDEAGAIVAAHPCAWVTTLS